MKKIIRIILWSLLGIVVIAQFIRPPRNVSEGVSPNDISLKYPVPPDVLAILQNSCFDCHSNNTRYPWYAQVQPVGWLLNNDIQDAKRNLNFSEFSAYRIRRQYIKLGQIAEQVNEGEMPLPSYLLIHKDAKLSSEQTERIENWVTALRDTLKAQYPDSLERRKQSQ